MAKKVGLFEHLAVPVRNHDSIQRGTEITLTDEDDYDVPDEFGLAAPGSSYFDSTMETRQDDGDTYDDDCGLGGLGVPQHSSASTEHTASDADTYDKSTDLLSVGLPLVGMIGTEITENDSETFDDDASIEGFSFPNL